MFIYVHISLFYIHMLCTYFMYLFAAQSTAIIILIKLVSISGIKLHDFSILKEIQYYNAGFWILWSISRADTERHNRTIVESLRTILTNSKLNKKYWSDVVKVSTLTLNQITSH
ncbi:hypothetical protein VP01_6088g1 [Puccinia sorghi]|uniref:Uncharacterized protein n=1 Tax=Puccinia sorghi TaxID=27349 RepID=A0A0L6UJ99_9BASI|nr:hypothetical protein VP01_6088g1 [Puccinia sorghi]